MPTGQRCAACALRTILSPGLLGARPLTPPGQAIQLAFAACICIADDDPAVMRALLSACVKNAYERGKAFLMLGLSDDDPLLAVARRYLHITYHSDLFAVSWSDDAGQAARRARSPISKLPHCDP